MKHTLVALMEDKPGVLNRVVNMFSRRAFNIESLSVGHTEVKGLSRMTVVVDGSNTDVEQVVKQLYKVIDVLKVSDVTNDRAIQHELMMVKVTTTRDTRAEIIQLAGISGARIVDVAQDSVIVELAAEEETIDDFVSLVRPFGIKELVRTGCMAMVRGSQAIARAPGAAELAHPTARPRYEAPRKKVAVDLTGEAG